MLDITYIVNSNILILYCTIYIIYYIHLTVNCNYKGKDMANRNKNVTSKFSNTPPKYRGYAG